MCVSAGVHMPRYYDIKGLPQMSVLTFLPCLRHVISSAIHSAYARLVGPQASMGLQALPAVLHGKTGFQMHATAPSFMYSGNLNSDIQICMASTQSSLQPDVQ